ncbi:MAG: amino acid permease [Vampirovibrionales bacterium]|nr:amino acid permease [Vampirovibrionales bacterium]
MHTDIPADDDSAASDHVSLKRTLGLFSAIAIAVGSMIGSGIFVVSADISRLVGTSGLLILVWVVTGVITVLGAVSYGKLAAHYPRAGGQYVFLREAWGDCPAFLYGWSLFTVIQSGTLAAVAVAFAKYAGVLFPVINSTSIVAVGAFDLSTQKILSVLTLVALTAYNATGIQNGALLQNIFTSLKVLALILLIVIGLGFGHDLFSGVQDWSLAIPQNHPVKGNWMTLVVFASVGALFSLDAWNYATFISAEVKSPEKTVPRAMFFGASTVVLLYIIANFAYLNLLPLSQIQNASEDRVATAALDTIFPGLGVGIMAIIILISTFGCLNGLMLAAARVFYVMAKDRLLFDYFGRLNPKTQSPNFSLWAQCVWASVLALSGTYSQLLEYTVFTGLLFYITTMLGLLKLAKHEPKALQMETFAQRSVPILYICATSLFAFFLLFGDILTGDFVSKIAAGEILSTKFFTAVAGLSLTMLGLPIYYFWKRKKTDALAP